MYRRYVSRYVLPTRYLVRQVNEYVPSATYYGSTHVIAGTRLIYNVLGGVKNADLRIGYMMMPRNPKLHGYGPRL